MCDIGFTEITTLGSSKSGKWIFLDLEISDSLSEERGNFLILLITHHAGWFANVTLNQKHFFNSTFGITYVSV